jgi:FlaA1/EpsC-like NDP-sugar epimerase
VLDMGEPVRIVALAENMIRLSGKEPGRNVSIEVVGARPGEKLHEELWGEDETVTPTDHPKIMRVTCDRADGEWLDALLAELRRLVEAGDTLELVSRLSSVVGQAQRAPAERRQRASAQAAPGAAEGATGRRAGGRRPG